MPVQDHLGVPLVPYSARRASTVPQPQTLGFHAPVQACYTSDMSSLKPQSMSLPMDLSRPDHSLSFKNTSKPKEHITVDRWIIR